MPKSRLHKYLNVRILKIETLKYPNGTYSGELVTAQDAGGKEWRLISSLDYARKMEVGDDYKLEINKNVNRYPVGEDSGVVIDGAIKAAPVAINKPDASRETVDMNNRTVVTEQEVMDLHKQARDLASRGFAEKRTGNRVRANACFNAALDLEADAIVKLDAIKLPNHHSICVAFHRSAAFFALNCEDYEQAESFAREGLGLPYVDKITDQLKEILKAAQEKRGLHL